MHSTARIPTLLIAVAISAIGSGTAVGQGQGSSLKLVAKQSQVRTEGSEQRPATIEQTPDLTPKAPDVPVFGDDIAQEPFSPAVPQRQSQPGGSPPAYAQQQPEYQEYEPRPYAPTGPGTHLQRHADRLRNYIDNRPRQMPLTSESWLNKPFGISYFLGGMWLDDPLHGQVGGNAGLTYGGRFSWDFSPSFGIETRIGGADVGLVDRIGGTELSPANIFYADVDWLWYFTGDTRWRPYVLIGSGLFDIDFSDAQPVRQHATLLQLPIGLGLKYRHTSRLAMRVDLIDNIAFSAGQVDTMHNWSLTAGIEARFGGGRKRNYWPWNPSREWW
jgi:hypothetical protein